MDLATLTALLHQYLTPDLLHKALEGVGVLTVLAGLAPRLLAWGLPAATRAADVTAAAILRVPILGPLVIWQAPLVFKTLDDITLALEKIEETFKNRLEADIKAAQRPSDATPEQAPPPAPVAPPPPAAAP